MDRLRQLLTIMSLAALLAVPALALGTVPAAASGRGECLFRFFPESDTFLVQITKKNGEQSFYTTTRPPKNCQVG